MVSKKVLDFYGCRECIIAESSNEAVISFIMTFVRNIYACLTLHLNNFYIIFIGEVSIL